MMMKPCFSTIGVVLVVAFAVSCGATGAEAEASPGSEAQGGIGASKPEPAVAGASTTPGEGGAGGAITDAMTFGGNSGAPDVPMAGGPSGPPLSDGEKPKAGLSITFSLERGWYSGDQTLTLSSPLPGAPISYAIGGGLPSLPYEGPITVTDNGQVVTVRARATLDGVPQPMLTKTFVFRPDVGGAVVVMNDSDLPVAPGETERPVTFEFIPSPKTGLLPVADEAGTATNMAGQSSGRSDKVYFRSEYGNGRLHGDVFGDLYYGVKPTDRHDHLYLRSDHTDRSMLRNIMAHDALLAMGQLSPHGRLVDFYDNGALRGTRYLHERPEGGFMESYLGIPKKAWIAVSGLDAIGTSLDTTVEYGTWAEVDQAINVQSLVDFLMVQWHAGVKDYEPLTRNWRATGPVGLGGDAQTDYRWHFFNWDIDRGYMRANRTFGSPMNIWERIKKFPEAIAIFQERIQCAFFNGGPLTVESMMTRLRARLAQLMTTSLMTEVWDDATAIAAKPIGLEDISTVPPLFVSEMEIWLVEREKFLFETAFTAEMKQARAPEHCP